MKIWNASKNRLIAGNARAAATFFARFKGLLGVRRLDPDEALYIPGCDTIHTFFMSISIDVLFIDGNNRIVKVAKALAPFRISCAVAGGAKAVIELAENTIERTQTDVGDIVTILEAERSAKHSRPLGKED